MHPLQCRILVGIDNLEQFFKGSIRGHSSHWGGVGCDGCRGLFHNPPTLGLCQWDGRISRWGGIHIRVWGCHQRLVAPTSTRYLLGASTFTKLMLVTPSLNMLEIAPTLHGLLLSAPQIGASPGIDDMNGYCILHNPLDPHIHHDDPGCKYSHSCCWEIVLHDPGKDHNRGLRMLALEAEEDAYAIPAVDTTEAVHHAGAQSALSAQYGTRALPHRPSLQGIRHFGTAGE
ncbi:hypothetical protein NEOLEDRAFT_1149008 [Neolentinus lepideus HHB14362 ss-1]|uniref:Uncharacterized protein n=1 Tax=Neolentinus lepideus HHB14362 ss-1 TaxID=1314782 RepID=A0A165RK94_9AGAM|nr:hypothetical protein NEOLEDRAFT_1149008 [Neolentinus lepideus HHB14362 ss-1]